MQNGGTGTGNPAVGEKVGKGTSLAPCLRLHDEYHNSKYMHNYW